VHKFLTSHVFEAGPSTVGTCVILSSQITASEPPNSPELSPFVGVIPSPTILSRNARKHNGKEQEDRQLNSEENIKGSSEKRRIKIEREYIEEGRNDKNKAKRSRLLEMNKFSSKV
jgi:hypothetical protein